MSKNLVIVESPAKAKTIAGFLGKEFDVKSSYGHVRDLPSKGMSVDIEANFKPEYAVSPDKEKVIKELKSAAQKADTIWLASDEDREGEAIAWHLSEALKLDSAKVKRIVFHEITKEAINQAIENPRDINHRLVDAQQARRVLDRLVGYELSPVLWKKVQRGLSAGRVQSVAVKLLVEREREIEAFEEQSSFKLSANLNNKQGEAFVAELKKNLEDQASAKQWLESLKGADFKVAKLTQKPGVRRPTAPFTTSTLQQEASRRLGYSVRRTMSLAQRLYESGHITYMRTDSMTLAKSAIAAAAQEIKDQYGEQYHQVRTFKTKSKSAQEAHEAIRPTHFNVASAGADEAQKKLYALIRNRTLASQMADAKILKTEAEISISTREDKLVAAGEVVSFDGFLKLYPNLTKDDKQLPKLTEGEELDSESIVAKQVFKRPPARYSEAALVKKLEELGIGRPSTYAPTISTIQDRGYVDKRPLDGRQRDVVVLTLEGDELSEQTDQETTGADKNKLIPTDIAEVVTDFLSKHFKDILDYAFTARVEGDFDNIAEGRMQWQSMIGEFYTPFHKQVKDTEDIKRSDASGARLLGKHPKTDLPIYARIGRYGPMIQMGETENEAEKPTFAPMPAGQKLSSVTLEQALPMFELPRDVGKTKEGEKIISNVGPYGPYIKVDKTYVSIGDKDPLTISEEEAQTAWEERKKANEPIQEFGDLKILRGRYGPYVTNGKVNARIPKAKTPEEITEAEAKELIEQAVERKSKKK